MTLKERALIWWHDLEIEEQEAIEKECGYYGHDIGTNEDDVMYFFSYKFPSWAEDE